MVGQCVPYKQERNAIEEEMSEKDGCYMDKIGRLYRSEKTIAILGEAIIMIAQAPGALRLCELEKVTRGDFEVARVIQKTRKKTNTPHTLGNSSEAGVGYAVLQQRP